MHPRDYPRYHLFVRTSDYDPQCCTSRSTGEVLEVNVSYCEPFDIAHVSEKFPGAAEYLRVQFGRANTRRRQLVTYNIQHHEKISGNYEKSGTDAVATPMAPRPMTPPNRHSESGSAGQEETVTEFQDQAKQHATSIFTAKESQTTITIYREQQKCIPEVCSETGRSGTSFAFSIGAEQAAIIDVPKPPDPARAFDGEPFQCPLCFKIVRVKGEQDWK